MYIKNVENTAYFSFFVVVTNDPSGFLFSILH